MPRLGSMQLMALALLYVCACFVFWLAVWEIGAALRDAWRAWRRR